MSQPKEEKLCMICLQDGGKNIHLSCKCKLILHSKCWEQYCISKQGVQECIVCHTKNVSSDNEFIDNSTFQNRCAACCCCCLLSEFFLQFI